MYKKRAKDIFRCLAPVVLLIFGGCKSREYNSQASASHGAVGIHAARLHSTVARIKIGFPEGEIDLTRFVADKPLLQELRTQITGSTSSEWFLSKIPAGLPKQYPNLDRTELAAIRYYSSDSWVQNNVDHELTSTRKVTNKNKGALIKGLCSALNKLPPHVGKVFNGSSWKDFGHVTVGAVLEMGYFFSTTTDVKVAHKFMGIDENGKVSHPNLMDGQYRILFSINGKSGSDISGIALAADAEKEVLYAPGYRFMVKSVENIQGAKNYFAVELDEI